MERTPSHCPCSTEVKSIGGCACDNMNINSECKALMFDETKINRGHGKPKELKNLSLYSSRQPLRTTVSYRKTIKNQII